MNTIYKYFLPIEDQVSIDIPPPGRIINIAEGGPKYIRLWAIVDPHLPSEKRIFNIYGTGHQLPNNPGTFINTVETPPFVWHVFDVSRSSAMSRSQQLKGDNFLVQAYSERRDEFENMAWSYVKTKYPDFNLEDWGKRAFDHVGGQPWPTLPFLTGVIEDDK